MRHAVKRILMSDDFSTGVTVMYQFLDVAATWWLQAAALAAIGLVASNALRKPALQSHVL